MSELLKPQPPMVEDQMRAWTEQLNRKTAELLTPEALQLNDLSSAYGMLDNLIANPDYSFGEQTIREAHTILSDHIPNIGSFKGRYYLAPRKIISAIPQTEILPFVQGDNKIPAMNKLGIDYGFYMSQEHPQTPIETVAKAADMITRMSDIHPFLDGNSRLGRLLADSIFLRQGMHQNPMWTDFKMGGADRKAQFYRMVEQSRRGNPEPLMQVLATEQANASIAEIHAIAHDQRVGEMREAKDAVDHEQEIIKQLSGFIEKLS